MHPIFVNTTNTTYNATFVRGYAVHDCPAGACYDEKTGMRYWGMVEIAFPAASPSHRPFLQRLFTESFQSARSEVSFSLADQDGNFTLFESAIPVAIDPVEVSIAFFNWNLQLRTSPVEGWLKHSVTQRNVEAISVPKPLWEVPLMALGVVCAVALGAAMLAMLVQKHLHQTLLQSMLPLKTLPFVERGRNFCERFETVTILFSDIVSFTNLAATMDPLRVVNMLNELYRMYDGLVDKYHVYKVETIGDAFMCAGGVPNAMTPAEGACAAADMGLDMIESTRHFLTSDGQALQIRVGLHSGPVVAAVIGLKMPHYCLFGDTVNTASRMESNSEAMRIHLSTDTAKLLQTSEKHYNLCARGKTNIKGKGNMFTYWLDTSPQEPTEQVIQFRLEPIISGLDFAMMAEANRPSQQRRSTMPELSLARISLSETV